MIGNSLAGYSWDTPVVVGFSVVRRVANLVVTRGGYQPRELGTHHLEMSGDVAVFHW